MDEPSRPAFRASVPGVVSLFGASSFFLCICLSSLMKIFCFPAFGCPSLLPSLCFLSPSLPFLPHFPPSYLFTSHFFPLLHPICPCSLPVVLLSPLIPLRPSSSLHPYRLLLHSASPPLNLLSLLPTLPVAEFLPFTELRVS